MRVSVHDSLEALALAVRELPAEGALPARTVLVRSERQAHALRVALATEPGALAGTRFVGPLSAAEEVLHAARVTFTPGEADLRPARLTRLFRSGIALEHFGSELLTTRPGWAEAFASAIHALESAGLGPADLPRTHPQLRDLAALWARADEEAGRSFTAARMFAEAAAALTREPRVWPFPGPVLAPVDGHEAAVLARFIRAIPGCALAVRAARPARARWIATVERLYGGEAAALVRGAGVTRAARAAAPTTGSRAADDAPEVLPGASNVPASELQRLQELLFHPDPAACAATLGPPSGPDGTVALEEHAGVESELEATATWVARQVLEGELPLARVAVLVPAQDPLAQLVAERIERLGLAVHVAGAVPTVATSAGARVLAVLRALHRRLPAADLAAVLPFVRLDEAELPGRPRLRGHLSHGDALDLAFSLGTAGGSPARPEGALAWSRRAAERDGELERAITVARASTSPSGSSDEREIGRLERTLRNLRAVRASLDALVQVARVVHEGRRIDAVWAAFDAFLRDAALLPGGADPILVPLREALAPACASASASASAAHLAVEGNECLDLIRDALLSLRTGRGRFGDPAVYVGTVEGAAGLAFDAVRIIGLAEGSIPSSPREDPVLPAALREEVRARTGAVLPSPDDRVAAQLHAFHAAVLGARRALALSAPRVDLARTEREPAALFIEVAAALGRPHCATGAPADPVPDAHALRRDAFEPSREAAFAFRRDHPIQEADWLARAARGAPDLPPSWRAEPVLDLARVGALVRPPLRLGAQDGLLSAGGPFPPVPGLAPGRPISASALGILLACPRRFLMQRVLGWDEPASAPPLRELDPATFGSLLHRVVERLYRDHGAALVAGERTLADAIALGRDAADAAFAEFLLELPLLGEKVREKELARLHDAVIAFLEYDLGPAAEPGRRFVAVERGFGTREAPLALDVPGGVLHVLGFVDRLDATPHRTIVRDVKSGAAHPREGAEKGPVPGRDVQLGLYVKVARRLARTWEVPGEAVGAYAYASGKGEVTERAFRDDAAVLERATEGWLGLARDLLAGRKFPATPDESDCGYCPFAPLCGSEEPERAAQGLEADDDETLQAFLDLKRGEGEP